MVLFQQIQDSERFCIGGSLRRSCELGRRKIMFFAGRNRIRTTGF